MLASGGIAASISVMVVVGSGGTLTPVAAATGLIGAAAGIVGGTFSLAHAAFC